MNNNASQEESLILEKTEIRNQFGSDNLPAKSLEAFESKARQKLTDLSDYLNILSDSSMNISFRAQSRLMLINTFLSDTARISNRFLARTDPGNVQVKALADDHYSPGTIRLDSIRIIDHLHFMPDYRYHGRLSFQRRIRVTSARDTTWSAPAEFNAEFFVSKISKSFGNEKLQIWNLSLGNIE